MKKKTEETKWKFSYAPFMGNSNDHNFFKLISIDF